MKRTIGQGHAFDLLFKFFEQAVEASASLESGLQPCSHISRIAGIIRHNMAEGDGVMWVGFYDDEGSSHLVAEFSNALDVGQHEIDIVPMADYVKFEVSNNDTESHTVSAAIAGHYGNTNKL